MGMLANLADISRSTKVYDRWEQENQNNYARKKYLGEHSDLKNDEAKQKQIKEKAAIILRAADILDNHSECAAADMSYACTIIMLLAELGATLVLTALGLPILALIIKAKGKKNLPSMSTVGFISGAAIGGVSLLSALSLLPWSAKKQIEASRVARFKAKEKDLADVRNFVIYNDEQKKEAEKNADKIPLSDIQQAIIKRDIKGAFNVIKKTDEDYQKYLNAQKENKGISEEYQNKLSQEFTPQELEEAKTDKEILLTGIRELNNRAESYSEDMEAAYGTIIRLAQFAVLPATFFVNKAIGKIKSIPARTNYFIYSFFLNIFNTLSSYF